MLTPGNPTNVSNESVNSHLPSSIIGNVTLPNVSPYIAFNSLIETPAFLISTVISLSIKL